MGLERWLWRIERYGFVGFEKEEERKERFGGGVDMVEGENEKNWILIVCGKIYCFICKILMWHVWIGGCIMRFYTCYLLNLIWNRF